MNIGNISTSRVMTRQKIQIKKIESITATKVTFSKRRSGLFKKAQELSTMCDAEIALIVFSSTGKLYDYASSSMQQVIERHDMTSGIHRLDRPCTDKQIGSDAYNMLRNEVANKTLELRQLNGEELQELTLQELQKLEELLEMSQIRVSKAKDKRIVSDIRELKRKGKQLKKENRRLKQVRSLAHEQGQSPKSVILGSSSDTPQHYISFDTSLKLGLV